VRQIGPRMKGVGNSFGFEKVSQLGQRIEDRAKTADGAALAASIDEYAGYLARVQIVYE
jgi:hypothetical protein